ncbi:DUF4347 domain-containing protein [Pseudanabaena sp. UWO310]|uniref:DUF4347 domain-containing protein n=1 Tax=Pseudanabaena sp. UWO310 TaxID=2480795 RepID=UPI0016802A17|nr:DUF4347 domain-containing protein [Pseudanabaena sp. UWO310]
MLKSTWGKYWATIAIAIALSPIILTAPVTAQSITAAQDGTNTVILPNGQRFDITGGTQAGANLFHSFQQFGLSQGQIANFLSQPNIQNILGRVVGGDPSVINGLIQLTGGNSNLYIMNPAGIIFGNNASLNVPASFTATTASGIQVGNSWFGMNTSASDLQKLNGTPNALAFTSPTSPLTQGQTSGVILNQGSLNVPQGKSISLVGGIVINTGTISTPNGTINIVAVPDGKYVRITPEGGVLSFDLPIATQQELGSNKAIAGIDLPKLLTGSGITAPTKAGEAIASGNLTAANINVLANRYNTTQASLNATNIQQGWNFVFIDSTIKNYQTLLDGTNGGSSVTLINPDQYGIQKVTETLASVTGANSLHIVSEGDVGNFWLGKDFVSTENIAKYANDLQAWKTALSPAANILLYACNLASGENGAALVQAVKNYTGHDVAASTDITGSSKLGGNWNLEYTTGKLNTGVVFSSEAQNSYDGRLVTFTATNTNDAGAGSLRQAILDANALAGADDIRFDPTVFNGSQAAITLASTLAINVATGDLNISGAFGASNVTVSGNNLVGVFGIAGNGNTTFDSLRIINGNTSGNGGGINNNGTGAVTLTNSTVSGNRANIGGGIYSNGAVTLTNSTVSGNTSDFNGGGIYGDGAVTLTNSTLSGNTASTGGGISGNGAVMLTNSTVSGNTASTGGGGGILGNGAVTLTNSTVSGNTSTTSDGGGIYGYGAVTLTDSTVSGNTASTGGGISGDGAVTLINSTVSGNTASSYYGGGIYGYGAVTLTNSTVSGNTATTNDGGGIYGNRDVTLTNSTVSGNTAGNNGDGGGIYGKGDVTLTNSTISGNTSTNDGGGIYGNGAVTLTNSTVSVNTSDFNGGGIYGKGAVTLTNSTVSGNTATTNDGGGISGNGDVTLINSTVSGNTAGNNGGGISGNGAVTLTNSTVSGNTASIGGGISGKGAVTLTNSTVSGNTATKYGNGGGISGISAVTLTNSTVSGNTAKVNGGGIYGISAVTLTNSTVSGNTATTNDGGGIYGISAVMLTNSTVSGNTAKVNGGGIYGNGAVTLTNGTVSGNTTKANGGGIYSNGAVTLTNSTVSGNTTKGNGGGIYSNGAVTLTNSTVSGNTANFNGGGIWGNNGGTIANSTITNNTADADNNGTADGGGIFRNNGTFTIRNSIIAGNFDRGLQAPDLGSSTAGVGFTNGGNNLIGANDGFAATFPTSSLIGTIANPINPQLAPLGNYGGTTQTHALLPNSPALNAGNNAGVAATDQRGATRIFGGVVDIGAFESQGFSLTPLANSTPQSTNINTSFAQLLGVQVTENFVNSPIPVPNILVTFAPSSSSASGSFAGNASVLTNNLGIAVAPTFTANGVSGSYTVAATATGFTPASFSLTNAANKVDGFGGVFPSREDLEGRASRLDEQDLELSFSQVLCLDPSLANVQNTSIPTCKGK